MVAAANLKQHPDRRTTSPPKLTARSLSWLSFFSHPAPRATCFTTHLPRKQSPDPSSLLSNDEVFLFAFGCFSCVSFGSSCFFSPLVSSSTHIVSFKTLKSWVKKKTASIQRNGHYDSSDPLPGRDGRWYRPSAEGLQLPRNNEQFRPQVVNENPSPVSPPPPALHCPVRSLNNTKPTLLSERPSSMIYE